MWIDFTTPINRERSIIDSNMVYSIFVSQYGYFRKGDEGQYTIIAKTADTTTDKNGFCYIGLYNTLDKANAAFEKLSLALEHGDTYVRIYDDLAGESKNDKML